MSRIRLDYFALEIMLQIGQDLSRVYHMTNRSRLISISLCVCVCYVGLQFGSKNTGKILIVFEDLSRNSVFL